MLHVALATIAAAIRFAVPAVQHVPNAGPIIAPLDQASDAILVGRVRPGERVVAFDDGFFIGGAIAQGPIADIVPERSLRPGDRIAVEAQYGRTTEFGRGLATVANDYTTYHYDVERTGWNSAETALTQANVASSSFGELFSTAVDSDVFAQPLYVSGVSIPGDGTHDVVYAATENDSVYAIDAQTGAVLWHQNYANSSNGLEPVPLGDVSCGFVRPAYGITGTPVIDRSSSTIYFVTTARQTTGSGAYHQYLHAADMTTGIDRPGSPVDIQGSTQSAYPALSTFDAHWQMQRPGLLLRNGVLYVGFGSYCDLHESTVHGWIFAYSAKSLEQLELFNTSPGGADALGSLWAGGYGIASDPAGHVYFATGNGDFNANKGGPLWGDTVLKMNPELGVLDYFTPYNQAFMRENDQDLGSGGPMVLPTQSGGIPNLVVEVGKTRELYLLDRNGMGQYTPGGPNHIVQDIVGAVGTSHGVWGGPGYYVSPSGAPTVFYCGGSDHLKAFTLMTSPKTELELVDETKMTFNGEGGAIPSVSSNGTTAGTDIVWTVERPSSADPEIRLLAFAADDLSQRLADLEVASWPYGGFSIFPVPTVIAGRVYVGTANSIVAFGLK